MKVKLILYLILGMFYAHFAHAIIMRGKIYDRDGDPNKQLFEFVRTEKMENGKKIVVVDFKDMEGKAALTEKLVYPAVPPSGVSVPFETYEFERFQNNEVVKIYPKENKLYFDYKKNEKIKKNDETIEKNTITRDQLATIVINNWDTLMKGETIKSRFIVPDRAETIGFKLFKDSEESLNGKSTVKITMKPSSFVIALLAKAIYFYFEKDGEHRLLRAVGRTPVLKKDGNDLKNIDGIIDFLYM